MNKVFDISTSSQGRILIPVDRLIMINVAGNGQVKLAFESQPVTVTLTTEPPTEKLVDFLVERLTILLVLTP